MTAMTYDEAAAHVAATNPVFAVTGATIGGISYRVFQNVPPNIPALLHGSRAPQGDGAADYLVFEGQRWTYDEFCSDCNRMAHVLEQTLNIGKGDRVALAMRNCPEMLMLMMAIASVGAVTVFLNGWWTTGEMDYALADSGARTVFADGDRMARLLPLRAARNLRLIGLRDGEDMTGLGYARLVGAMADDTWPDPDIAPDDDFVIMYSSGTTGDPKGVVLTHRGAVNAVFSWLMQAVMEPLMNPPEADANAAPRPSVLVVTPLFHVTATHPMFLLSLPAGAKLTVMAKWDAEEAARLIADEEITRFLGVPTQSADLMAAAERLDLSLPTLDFMGAGGAKRPAAQVAQLARVFPHASIATGWGMTETNALGIGMGGADYIARPGAAGRLYPPVQDLRFLDDAGNDVPFGMLGEIAVKSPTNMRCYLNQPDATAEALRDGWLLSGDLGMIDADGYVTIVDRKKNIIIRGGENIACLDVEGALHRHPDVIEACVFSVPHPRLGEVVGAAIHLRPDARLAKADLVAFLGPHIARFKIPEHIWFQSTPLPRGTTDKQDRRALRTTCLAAMDQGEIHQ